MNTNKSPAYLIRATRHYYTGTIHRNGRVAYYGRHLAEHGMDPDAPIVAFPSREAARAAIEEIETKTYYLSYGEYSSPTLRAVPVSSAPASVRNMVS
jgi:hypothetical protein